MKINKNIIAILGAIATLAVSLPVMADDINSNISSDTNVGEQSTVQPVTPLRAEVRVNIEVRNENSSTSENRILNRERIASSSEIKDEINQERRSSSTENRIQNGENRGDSMINLRIDSLNKLITRIQGMKKVSDQDKSNLEDSINIEISDLNNLRNSIGSSTSTTTLRQNLGSITNQYRIFALAEPQANITAAGDRIFGIISSMNIISVKINSRIASSSILVSTNSQAALTDFSTQISTATSLANQAINEVVNLKSDNGDMTIAASNKTALQDARSKIVSAQKALNSARNDIEIIVKEIMSAKIKVNNSTTIQSSTTNQ